MKDNNTAKCLQCGKEFTKTTALNELCSYACKKERHNELRGPYVSIKVLKEKIQLMTTCIVCGKEFPSEYGKKICSGECRTQSNINYRKNYLTRLKATMPEKVKAVKPIKVKAIKPVKEKPIKQVVHIQSLNKKTKGNEKDAALNMLELNRNAPRHDKEIINKKNIVSPKLSDMGYHVHDKKMKITYYFRTEQKYLNHLKNNPQ